MTGENTDVQYESIARQARETLPRLVEGGLMEGVLVRVLVPSRHPGVGVVQPGDAGNAQRGRGVGGLEAAPIDQGLALGEVVGLLTVIAIGRKDDDHPSAGSCGTGH